MYIVQYRDRKVVTGFKHEPNRYMATVYFNGQLIEAFARADKRKLKNLLRRCGYIK